MAPVTAAVEQLEAIYARLNGDVSVLHAARENLLLPVDLVHEPTGTVIEVDESAHFTSFRLAALDLYPADAPVAFDLDEHKKLCRAWCSSTDGLESGFAAKGFGFGGVQRERAYHDTLRDLATPAMGHPPVVRIAAVDGDGAAAYRRHRDSLRTLLGAVGPFVPVDHRHVDRRAPPAANPHLLRHLHRVHRLCKEVAALHADVVVRPIAAEDGPIRVLLKRGPAVARHLALADLSHRNRRHRGQRVESLPLKSLISASRTPWTTPSPIDAAFPVICALVLTVPPPSVSEKTTSAFA